MVRNSLKLQPDCKQPLPHCKEVIIKGTNFFGTGHHLVDHILGNNFILKEHIHGFPLRYSRHAQCRQINNL